MTKLTNLKDLLNEEKHNHNSSFFFTLENKKRYWLSKINQKYVNGTYYIHQPNTPNEEYYQDISSVKGGVDFVDGLTRNATTNRYTIIKISFNIETKSNIDGSVLRTNSLTNYQWNNLKLETTATDTVGFKDITSNIIEKKTNEKSIILKFDMGMVGDKLKLTIPTDKTTSSSIVYRGITKIFNIVHQEIGFDGTPTVADGFVNATIKSVNPSNFVEGQILSFRSNVSRNESVVNNWSSRSPYTLKSDENSHTFHSLYNNAPSYSICLESYSKNDTIYTGDMLFRVI